MADGTVDTSIYPKAGQNSFLDTMSQVQALKNAGVQNQLLQTETQRQGVGLSQDKITLAHQGFQWLSQGLGSLAQDPRISTPAGPAMLKQFAAQGVQQGWLTPEVANTEIANAPTDPAQLPQYLQNLNVRAQDAANQFAQIYGTPQIANNGNVAIPLTMSSIRSPTRIGADIPMQTSPSERLGGVPGFDSAGRPTITPNAIVMKNAGMNPLTGMPATAPNSPANQLQPYPPGQAPVQAGSVPVGPPAGQIEAQTQAAKVSSDKYSADAAAQTNYQQNITPIEQAFKSVQALGTKGIGPGSDELNQMKSFLVTMGVFNPDDNLKNFDEANKYLTQMARSSGFTGSDAQLAAAQQGSPSMKTSNGAALAVLQKAAALTRMQNAQVRAFEASGQGPESYSKWATKWNTSQNPIAYAFDMMSPEDRTAYVKNLKGPERQKFITSLQTATQLGLVTPPQAGNGG